MHFWHSTINRPLDRSGRYQQVATGRYDDDEVQALWEKLIFNRYSPLQVEEVPKADVCDQVLDSVPLEVNKIRVYQKIAFH